MKPKFVKIGEAWVNINNVNLIATIKGKNARTNVVFKDSERTLTIGGDQTKQVEKAVKTWF